MKYAIQKTLGWLLSLSLPFFLIITAVRLLATPLFPQVEYRMPGFPEDLYGFSQADRLYWAPFAIEYLTNDQPISFLGDLHFSDGTPLYNERELSHMVDVKNLVQAAFTAWWIMLVFMSLMGGWAWRGKWLPEYWHAYSRGGWITVGLIVAILIGVVTAFDALFTGFHRIFFTGDTWLFYYSDTLIRLFPMRFWQDAFTAMGIFTGGAGLALGWFLRKQGKQVILPKAKKAKPLTNG